MRRVVFSTFVTLLCATYAPLSAQDAAAAAKASPYISVAGTVTKSDVAAKVVSVKPDKGTGSDPANADPKETTVKFDERTSFMRIPAGETDVKKATPSEAKEIETGDKIIARVLTADPTGKAARTIIFTKQSDIALRQQKTQEEWKNATNGTVTNIDPAGRQIKFNVKVPGTPAPKEVVLDVAGKVDYQRYNPDAGKYEAGKMDQIKVGDQMRVLGQKNADMTAIKADALGFGSFKTIGIVVKTVDTNANLITGTEIATKKPVTIALRPDTHIRKFSEMAAMMVARQLNPSFQQTGGRGGMGGGMPGGGGRGGDRGSDPAAGGGRGGNPQGPPAGMMPGMASGGGPGGPGGAGPGGRGGGGRGGRGGMDVGSIIEQQPTITLAELKPGDSVIVTGAIGNDPAKLTANALVAGVEIILRAAPAGGADPLAGSWNMGGDGGGGN